MDEEQQTAYVIASRAIARGEEVPWNYGGEYWCPSGDGSTARWDVGANRPPFVDAPLLRGSECSCWDYANDDSGNSHDHESTA